MSYELSVIIPVYNVEKYIGECLDSVVNQSIGIDNIEVIVVNDATPDNSMDIINEYVEKYQVILVRYVSVQQSTDMLLIPTVMSASISEMVT